MKNYFVRITLPLLVTSQMNAAFVEYVSDEVGEASAGAGAPRNLSGLRNTAGSLDDAWMTDATSLQASTSNSFISRIGVTPGTSMTGTSLDFGTTPSGFNLTASISLRDMTTLSGLGVAANSQGTVSGTSGTGSLQDRAIRPSDVYGAGTGGYWNEGAGAGNSRNAVLISFDAPVLGFGAWWGDVESRSDGRGEQAIWRAFDSSGAQIGGDRTFADTTSLNNNSLQFGGLGFYSGVGSMTTGLNPSAAVPPPGITDPTDRETGSTASNGGGVGAGNGTTRWVGFISDTPISQVLMIVGDDDAAHAGGTDPADLDNYGVGTSTATGNSEHLSFIGVTVFAVPEPSSVTLLGLMGLIGLTRRSRS